MHNVVYCKPLIVYDGECNNAQVNAIGKKRSSGGKRRRFFGSISSANWIPVRLIQLNRSRCVGT